MARAIKWCETQGGPHIVVPEEYLSCWRGIEGWRDHADPADQSDYARACRVRNWLGVLSCGASNALVLGGDVGPIAWYKSDDSDGGLLVQWIGADNHEDVTATLNSPGLASALYGSDSESAEFAIGDSGAVRLFDAAESGDDIRGDSKRLNLIPGRHLVLAGYLETEKVMLVVRQIRPIG